MTAQALTGNQTAITAQAPFSADIDGLLCNVNSAFNPLHKDCLLDFHVSGARDGYVFLSIALPEGMTRAFTSMLESLSGFFRCIDIKARSAVAQGKVHDPARRAQVEQSQAEFRETVCTIFDSMVAAGLEIKEAVRRTNLTLKEQKHPWATHDIVSQVLRSTGRFRKRGRVKHD